MCVRSFFTTQAGFRTHDVKLSVLLAGWNVVSFRALDGLNSFNLIYIFYPSPISPSPQHLSPKAVEFVSSLDQLAASTCPSTSQLPSSSPAHAATSFQDTSHVQLHFFETHCTFRCPASFAAIGGGDGRTLLAMTVRNGWPHTQVVLSHSLQNWSLS
jgi:hypothetical protein